MAEMINLRYNLPTGVFDDPAISNQKVNCSDNDQQLTGGE